MASEHGPLAGKVAIVTGSSRGIGEEIAYELAKQGAKVRRHLSSPKLAERKSLDLAKEPSSQAFRTEEEIIWSAADAKSGQQQEPAPRSRVLSNRFGQAVRDRMSKLIHGKDPTSDVVENDGNPAPSKDQQHFDEICMRIRC